MQGLKKIMGQEVYLDSKRVKHGDEMLNEVLEDTGWISVPYKSGMTYHNANSPLQYRIKNGVFYTRGTFKKISGNFTTDAYEEIATFPTTVISRMPHSAYDTVIMVPSGGGREAARGYISTAGVLNIRKSAYQDFTYGILNLTFPLD